MTRNGTGGIGRFGSRLAFAEAGLFLLLLGIALAYRANWIGHALALVLIAFYVIGSGYLLMRLIVSGRGEAAPLGQAAALPRRLRRWVLGESDGP